jgi:nucleoside-diphosphate-sugar epimerase
MDPWPVPVPAAVEDLDLRAEIWRCGLPAGRWACVHRSPEIEGRNGRPVPRELGYRGMTVFKGRSDPRPALYVSSVSSVSRGTGARILRSLDGRRFKAVSEPGLGNPNVSSFRSLTEFDGRLYLAPAGEGTTWNTVAKPIILRSDDPASGGWEVACLPGFGSPTNSGIFELQVFDGHLYAGTFNAVEGYQVWKTPPTGAGPCRWTKVVECGAHRGPNNEMAMSMCPFEGALYVGSGLQNGGYDRHNLIGPAAAELIRIYPDDSWELVVGDERDTPDGTQEPVSGAGPGFDNLFAGYIWRMAVHDGWLYASTFDWSVFLPYAQRPPAAVRQMMRRLGVERMVDLEGGFGLVRTRDGSGWTGVTSRGLGNPYNHGGRNLLSTAHGLFVGTANPFGPEVAARISNGWVYVPNPSGGAEVWIGSADSLGGAPEHHRPVELSAAPSDNNRRVPRWAVPRAGESPKDALEPRTLVTGASGFVGSRVLDELLGRSQRVRVLALEDTVRDIQHSGGVEIVTGSLANFEALTRAVAGVETVYHLAALLPGASRRDLQEVNVRGTERLLEACRAARRLKRFIFASSAAVYEGAFSPDDWPLRETATLGPSGPETLRDYGESKIAAERLVKHHAGEGGFEYTVLRPPTSYGVANARFTELVERVLENPRAGWGRDAAHPLQLIHVRDLGRAIADAGSSPAGGNDVFNVAGAEVLGFCDIAQMIRALAGMPQPGAAALRRSRQWRRYLQPYDTTKARMRLGFAPRVSVREGFAELVLPMLKEGRWPQRAMLGWKGGWDAGPGPGRQRHALRTDPAVFVGPW